MIAASARGLALNLAVILHGAASRSAGPLRLPHRLAGLLAGFFSFSLVLGARAEGRPSAIVLAFDESSAAQKEAITAIRAHVQDLSVQVEVVAVEPRRSLELRLSASGELAASRHALGTFYIDVADDRSLLIFFTEADGEATLIRRLPPDPRGWRVALEQAAIVARSLVEALLEGGSVGIGAAEGAAPAGSDQSARAPQLQPQPAGHGPSVAEPEPSTNASREPPKNEASGQGRRLAIGAGAVVTSFASEVPWQSGLSLGLHGQVAPDLVVGVRYTVFPALRIGNADAEFSVQRHPIELTVGFREGGRLALTGEASLMADRATRTTLRTATAFQPMPPDARWLGALGGRVGFSWSPWDPVYVSLRVGADFLLTPYSYAIDSGQALPAPRWVRPWLELEALAWVW